MTIESEHRAVREGCGVVDRSDRGRLTVRGGDRTSFLHGLVSNDVAGVHPGAGVEALLLYPKGKLISDLVIHVLADHILVEVPPERREVVFGKLDMYTLSADVAVADGTDDLALLGVHGPKAIEIVAALTGAEVPAERLSSIDLRIGGVDALAVRVDYLGEDGIDLHFPAGSRDGVLSALTDAGAAPVGPEAAESLRVEAGVARYGAEFGEDLLPPEVPALVTHAISYTKGCYVGQETIARIKTYGHVNRELRGLVLEGDRPPAPGDEVTVDGKRAGIVTSSAAPPTLDLPIALAFMKREHLEPGTEVEVAGMPARVVRLPAAGGRWAMGDGR